MRAKPLMVLSTAAVALVLAACGSSSKSSSSSSTGSASGSTPTTTTAPGGKKGKHHAAKGKLPSRTYKLKLTGKAETPAGAPKGVGVAVVTLRGKTSQVCWKFSHLHGFTKATFAHIHKGASGTSGSVVVPLSTGPALKHAGCAPASAALISAIAKDPHGFYVNIHSAKYAGGAVRAQL